MSLSRLAIENHKFTTIIIALLVIFGITSILTMPRSEDPLVTPPGTNVIVIYPGASPEELEELVIQPIEEVVNELEDIKKLASVARDGYALVEIEFEAGVDMDDKYSQIVQKVNGIRDELPENIADLEIWRWSISDVAILQLGIISEFATYRELEKEAELLKDLLEKQPGVKKIEISAFPEQEVRIAVNLERMAQYGISLSEVEGAIVSANANIPGGHIDIGTRRFTIKTSGPFESLDEIRKVAVRSDRQQILYVDDIADVHFDYDDKNHIARVNGDRAVFVTVKQKERTNIFSVMDGVKSAIADFQSKMPAKMELKTVFDQSESVARRLNSFFGNLFQGLFLVGLVVLLVSSLRTAGIVILAIPISILVGLGLLDLSDYGLQQMTIAGLVIALGLLVDNAIVVTDNITRFMRRGEAPREAAVKGTAQISWAIISSTVTTVLAFFPMIMLPGVTGDFIRSMPATVIFTLVASLMISLTLTPYLSSRFIKPASVNQIRKSRRILDSFIAGHYRKVLETGLNRPKMVLLLATIVFLGSLMLFPVIGVSFFPKAEKPQFMINIDLPDGANLAQTDAVAAYVDSTLQKRDDIRHWATNIGAGNPRIYYNMFQKSSASNHAQIYVELKNTDLASLRTAISELRKEFWQYPGAEIRVKELEQGPPIEAPIAIRIIGENMDTLRSIAADVEQVIASVPGTINIDNPLGTSKTDLRVKINREKAASAGVPLVEIDRTVRAAMAGLAITGYNDASGKEYDIVVKLPDKEGDKLTAFDRIYISSHAGKLVPLKQVASLEFASSPTRINRYNLNRNVMITADVIGTTNANEATMKVIEQLEEYDLPKGYYYLVAGELESRQESFGGMGRAVIIALLAIFAVLVLQFRSYIQPLIVYAAIPLALVGSILALFITGNTFSFTAFIGITSLVGIVINNSIILVDYVNQLRRRGMEALEAIKKAGQTRFAPILLTTFTTIGGLLPLTLQGGTLWAPMGWAIIGGLIVSTFLTLLVVPVLYRVIAARKPID
ncbi:MAG: MMPL family transporter [candidate division Zixibacteria bacterium]|nr:MMPL family transporter [candidate division Zixibacteria bacterium]